MNWRDHARTTGTALKNWFVAQCYDSAAVALLWLVGLMIIGIPWALLWAFLAGLLQFVPNFGGPITVFIPAIFCSLSPGPTRFFYLLLLFTAFTPPVRRFLEPFV